MEARQVILMIVCLYLFKCAQSRSEPPENEKSNKKYRLGLIFMSV